MGEDIKRRARGGIKAKARFYERVPFFSTRSLARPALVNLICEMSLPQIPFTAYLSRLSLSLSPFQFCSDPIISIPWDQPLAAIRGMTAAK